MQPEGYWTVSNCVYFVPWPTIPTYDLPVAPLANLHSSVLLIYGKQTRTNCTCARAFIHQQQRTLVQVESSFRHPRICHWVTEFGLRFRLSKRKGRCPVPSITPQVSLGDTCPDPPPPTHQNWGPRIILNPGVILVGVFASFINITKPTSQSGLCWLHRRQSSAEWGR